MTTPNRPQPYTMSAISPGATRPGGPATVASSEPFVVRPSGQRVIFVGPFPPDVHGQAVSTLSLYNCLLRDGVAVDRVDVNTKDCARLAGRLRRIVKHFDAAGRLLLGGAGPAYISVNANVGMWMSAALALLARIRGRAVFLHHHTYTHFARSVPAAEWLVRIAGPEACHIVICPQMGEDLMRTYGRPARFLSLGNIDAVDPSLATVPAPTHSTPISLGHLSNLTAEKGVVRVIEAFRAAKAAGLAERLIIAGPCSDATATSAVEAASREFAEAFDYRGMVQGEAKHRFFSDIDVFLFPSLYPNETEGIVTLEALAAGKPTIAHGLCCIPRVLNDSSCRVVPPTAPFTPALLEFLETVRTTLPEMSASARARYVSLRKERQDDYDKLLADLSGRPRSQ